MNRKRSGCGPFVIILILALVLILISIFHYRDQLLYYFFPLDYRMQVEAMAEEYALDPWLIFAIIRVESNFDARAKSRAGAQGLMQLMPSTTAWIVEKTGLEIDIDDIWQPENNIRLGCWYLDWLRDYYYGDMIIGIAAYNAGIANVDAWLNDGKWDGSYAGLPGVPYAETRRYIRNVYENYNIYLKIYSK
ncbi:MAG: lytic transglycosylase domain-containing protein [Clostridiales bacterium]|nr:lytic transglycosylase domain-containing protein [Clostridiales bacterium]